MHRFGDQIELRVDRRHLLLFFLGAIFWTLVAFFFGMLVAGEGKTRTAERGLSALGWLDRQAIKQREARQVAFAFATRKPPTKRAARALVPRPAARPAVKQPVARRQPAMRRQPVVAPAPRPAARRDAPTPRKAPAAAKGAWTYRIAMRVKRRKRMQALKRRFQRQGYKPKVDELYGGRVFRLTFGRFGQRERADRIAGRLKREKVAMRVSVIRVR